MEALGEEIFEGFFDEASEKERQVLAVLAEKDEILDFATLSDILKKEHNISATTMSKLLERLLHKRIIDHPGRGLYFIPDVLFRKYLKEKLKEPSRFSISAYESQQKRQK